MLWKLILLLTLVPAAELYLLVALTRWWDSLLLTLVIILVTGVVGAALARHEGLRVMRRMREEMASGRLPADSILDGVLILMAGALLVTPGVMTDVGGLLLLAPLTRVPIRGLVKRWIRAKLEQGRIDITQRMDFGPIRQEPPPGAPPLEDDPPQDA